MKTKIKLFLKENGRYAFASFLIPFLILALVYLSIGIYPGSSRSILASDAFSQFSNFHASFRNMLLGKQSIFYTWNASLGLNYLSLISYYLGGLFTPLVLLFPNNMMPDALYFLTLLKVGFAGLSFWFLARTYKIPRWGQVALSVSYASISFITAHSEIIMWLDAFIYLPLIILGIHRVMDYKRPTLLFVSYLLLFLSSFYMGFMIVIFRFLIIKNPYSYNFFFSLFYGKAVYKMVTLQKIDCTLWDYFLISWWSINDHYSSSSLGSPIKWRNINTDHYTKNRSYLIFGYHHEKHDRCL